MEKMTYQKRITQYNRLDVKKSDKKIDIKKTRHKNGMKNWAKNTRLHLNQIFKMRYHMLYMLLDQIHIFRSM